MRHYIFSVLIVAFLAVDSYAQSAPAAKTAAGENEAVAVVNGNRVITRRDVDDAAGRELAALEERIYTLRQRALDDLIDKILLEQEANTRGITVEELRRRMMGEKIEISDADVDREYAAHGSAVALARGTHGVDDTKRVIRLDLEKKAGAQRFQLALADLRSKSRIDLLSGGLELPRVSVSDSGPAKGPKDAPITIVEFSDFQCPFCKQAQAVLDQLLKIYPDKIRLVFKELPVPAHPQALGAAEAAFCADAQGRFWPYHDKLFASEDLSKPALLLYARDVQLDAGEFEKCLISDAVRQAIVADEREAVKIDAHATPTFVVNGRIMSGFIELAAFEQQIDLQLASLNRKP